jgi:surface antigen
VPILALLALAGCKSIGGVAGVIAAAGTGSASGNPAVGIAVGIAVRSGVNALADYLDRRRHQGEQDAIAEAAGAAPLGAARPWEIHHTIPIGNERGELQAVREFQTPLTTCREIVFTVVDGEDRDMLTTTLCREADGWRWAAAEPAVDRWGYLQ